MKPTLSVLLLIASLASLRAAEPTALSPDALAAEVAAQHPELRFLEAELAAARADLRAAGARSDPELALQAGRQRVHESTGALAGEGTAWSVSLTQTFEWPGRLALRKAVANRDVALAELGLAQFRSTLLSRARTLACSLWIAQEKSAAAAEVAARFRDLRETFLARDPAGLTPLLETRIIEAQELMLQRRATEAALAAAAALTELNQLRGLPPETPTVATATPLAFQPAPALPALLAAAREYHFPLRAKRLELERQGFAVSLARHERKPAIAAGPYVAQETATGRDTTVGLSLSLPLPVSSRHRASVDAAESRRAQAEAAILAAEREMERDVISTAQTFAAKLTETTHWSPDSVAKFRDAAALADRHYRLGAVPLSVYVELQSAYLDAVDTLLDTQFEVLESGLRLELLTGLNLHANTP